MHIHVQGLASQRKLPSCQRTNCPNLNSSGTQNCSCSRYRQKGQCINETRTVLPPDETRIPRTTDGVRGVLVVASVTITIMWTSLCIAKLMRNRLKALDAGIIIASSLTRYCDVRFMAWIQILLRRLENDLQLGFCQSRGHTALYHPLRALSSNQDDTCVRASCERPCRLEKQTFCPECAVSF